MTITNPHHSLPLSRETLIDSSGVVLTPGGSRSSIHANLNRTPPDSATKRSNSTPQRQTPATPSPPQQLLPERKRLMTSPIVTQPLLKGNNYGKRHHDILQGEAKLEREEEESEGEREREKRKDEKRRRKEKSEKETEREKDERKGKKERQKGEGEEDREVTGNDEEWKEWQAKTDGKRVLRISKPASSSPPPLPLMPSPSPPVRMLSSAPLSLPLSPPQPLFPPLPLRPSPSSLSSSSSPTTMFCAPPAAAAQEKVEYVNKTYITTATPPPPSVPPLTPHTHHTPHAPSVPATPTRSALCGASAIHAALSSQGSRSSVIGEASKTNRRRNSYERKNLLW